MEQELLQKLISKTFEINRNTRHNVFLNFSGHTEGLEIFYCKNGWNPEKELTYLKKVYLDEKSSIEELQNLLKDLEKLERRMYESISWNDNFNNCWNFSVNLLA